MFVQGSALCMHTYLGRYMYMYCTYTCILAFYCLPNAKKYMYTTSTGYRLLPFVFFPQPPFPYLPTFQVG